LNIHHISQTQKYQLVFNLK